MKIQKIHVNNYRMLQNLDLDLESELSLVIGKNNCGKTSLLSILDKFIGGQSSTNNFTYDDFNSDFQNQIYSIIKDGGIICSHLKIKVIELFLYIEFDDKDNLSNIKPLMLDLNPDNNIVVLKFEYSLPDQKVKQLLDDFVEYKQKYEGKSGYNQETEFDRFMKKTHKKYFSLQKKAILFDINQKKASETEYKVLDAKSLDLSKIICFRCISARRDTANKEGDNTLSNLSNRYYEKTKNNEDNPAISDFEDTLHETDKTLSGVYQDLFKEVVGKIKKFGGVRENETVIKVISTLSQQQLLKGNTMVVYENNDHQIPETYNGLGYLNLISIIMEIEIYLGDFLKINDDSQRPADINLLFIEEPEAHTHPQLQYIFIKNIKELLGNGITNDEGERIIDLQTILTTHSSHIVSESEFDDIKYFTRSSNTSIVSRNLKDLEIKYKDEKNPVNNHFKFLKQYLTLNYAEIFFADKVILYEGETEQILLPAMLKKIDEEFYSESELPMLSQNISLISSGAYSHIFDKLLSFIGIKTLIITDIDSAIESKKQDKNGKTVTRKISHSVEGADCTTNAALLHYYKNGGDKYSGEKQIDFFVNMNADDKILKKDGESWIVDKSGNLMVVFQTKEENEYYPRSFEDAFIHINRDFLVENKESCESLQNRSKIDEKNADGNYICDAYEIAGECIKSKASFALDILINSVANEEHTFSNWKIPPYIEEGLLWLRKD